eukprot:1826545-Alexandrium_andersonii.AAC.1
MARWPVTWTAVSQGIKPFHVESPLRPRRLLSHRVDAVSHGIDAASHEFDAVSRGTYAVSHGI